LEKAEASKNCVHSPIIPKLSIIVYKIIMSMQPESIVFGMIKEMMSK